MKHTLTPQKNIIKTLINCSEQCCGCLNGKIKKDTINFYCNECGRTAGYMSITTIKSNAVEKERGRVIRIISNTAIPARQGTATAIGSIISKIENNPNQND